MPAGEDCSPLCLDPRLPAIGGYPQHPATHHTMKPDTRRKPPALKPLRGVRILSLALNLPGPAALMRLCQMGARCTKLEPPAPAGMASGDPMGQYNPAAYAELHAGVKIVAADLKTPAGRKRIDALLARTDVLLTSFRPSALAKLDLAWPALHRRHPLLSQVAIVGAPGERAEEPGHDLTYLAEHGLVPGLELPSTLYADMGGSLMASEAVLQAVLAMRSAGRGVFIEVPLANAAAYLATPRRWGMTTPQGVVGGLHAGYRVYPCKDGRVAVAALEPHFAQSLCEVAGITAKGERIGRTTMLSGDTHKALAAFFKRHTRQQWDTWAHTHDLPLLTLPPA